MPTQLHPCKTDRKDGSTMVVMMIDDDEMPSPGPSHPYYHTHPLLPPFLQLHVLPCQVQSTLPAYSITQLLFFCPFVCFRVLSPLPLPPGPIPKSPGSPVPVFLLGPFAPPIFLCFLRSLTTSKKARSTLTQFFALASTNSHPSSRASEWPSCVLTSRSVTLSLLFPTSMMGTFPAAGGAPPYSAVELL